MTTEHGGTEQMVAITDADVDNAIRDMDLSQFHAKLEV